MKASAILDQVELELRQKGIRYDDRALMLKHMSFDLATLCGMEDWDWAMIAVDPVIKTITGKRDYDLPANFPDNFVRWGTPTGQKWLCNLDDGVNDNPLDYVSPAQFYSMNLSGQTNSRPSKYTVLSNPAGGRRLYLSPPPDANGSTTYYTIHGLYVPTDWALHDESNLPPIPGNCMILKGMLMRRYDQNAEAIYGEGLVSLYRSGAKNRQAGISPRMK